MPVTFTWDINPASLLALAAVGFACMRFWLFSGKKADDAMRDAAAAMDSARLAHDKITNLQAAINAHQIMQAERLVSREGLREVEVRLAGAIENLGERFDGVLRDVIRQSRPPPG